MKIASVGLRGPTYAFPQAIFKENVISRAAQQRMKIAALPQGEDTLRHIDGRARRPDLRLHAGYFQGNDRKCHIVFTLIKQVIPLLSKAYGTVIPSQFDVGTQD